MKRHFLSVCAALFALMVLCSVATRAADNVYAILYDDGTLVFQHGDTPESGKTVKKMYEVDLNKVYTGLQSNYAPWDNEWNHIIRVANFADKISPTAMAYWFHDCYNLERVDNIQNLDTSKVTTMGDMFYRCQRLVALDVSHFDTANVTNMERMFYDCSRLTALDFSGWDTSNVTNMQFMFCGCSGLTMLDVSHFDTSEVTNMFCMFDNCSNLKTIYASDKFTTTSVSATYGIGMFSSCTSLIGGNGTKYNDENPTYETTNKTYAQIDTPSAPGYFTAKTQPEPEPQPNPETYVITAYAGEGGTVTPAGDTRISAGGTQKYVMTPNPGYRVQSVRVDGVEVGALSEYVFQNVVTGHNLVAAFEKLPRYAITAAVGNGDELSVTLENSGSVTVAVWYSDRNGKFLSADMQTVSANAGTVTFPLPFAYRARVTLLDSGYCPLCDPVTVR